MADSVAKQIFGKNANVTYETGIAHTLGKHVIPITRQLDDVPFDIRDDRVLAYLPNGKGLAALAKKLVQFASKSDDFRSDRSRGFMPPGGPEVQRPALDPRHRVRCSNANASWTRW